MTLLHYPPGNPNDGFGIHPHKDTDALTLLFPDAVGGLWLRPHDQDEWLEVEAPDDAMVVNIGNLLELWSGVLCVHTAQGGECLWQGALQLSVFYRAGHDVVVAPLIDCQPGFERAPVPVGPVSREVWRTNWLKPCPRIRALIWAPCPTELQSRAKNRSGNRS